MARQSLTKPKVQAGRRGHPVACDCCNQPIEDNGIARGYRWNEIEVGPASFAWAVCSECSFSEADKKLHWIELATTRARRYRPNWANAAEKMMMEAIW